MKPFAFERYEPQMKELTMSKDMLGMVSFSAAWRLITDLMQKLAGPEGGEWLEKLKCFLRKEMVVWNKVEPVLVPGRAIAVPPIHIATHYQFDECLKLKDGSKIRIHRLGDDFRDRFLSTDEASPGPGLLERQVLSRETLDMDILLELGERAQTSCAHLFELLVLQPNGEEGELFVEGTRSKGNIFYALGNDTAIWCIKVWWLSGQGWEITATSVGSQHKHRSGDQVFFRKKV